MTRKSKIAESGSPKPGEPEYLMVGTLRRPHGLGGELLMDVLTDFPERLKRGTQLFVGSSRSEFTVGSSRTASNGMLLKLKGIDTPEAAGLYRNQPVYVTAADRPKLPAGQYYHHELLGSTVNTNEGKALGALADIMTTGANDVLVVRDEAGQEILIPNIPGVVLGIDKIGREILVKLPEGLLES